MVRTALVASVPGPQGSSSPRGPAGGFDPSSLTRGEGPVVPVPADESHVYSALPCGVGAVALSGGWYVPGSANERLVRVAGSYPSSALEGWSFRLAYQGAARTSVTMTPYVVCAGA